MRYTWAALVAVALAGGVSVSATAQDAEVFDGFTVAVDAEGKITLPKNAFRNEWTSLGSFVVNGDEGAEGMHTVYTQRGVVEAYLEKGSYPDGAVLVKELLNVETHDMMTGTVSYAHEVEGWFVMVKDTQNRYPDNPLWGDGWGWGFFSAEDPEKLVTADYRQECRACHVPAKSTDWSYVQGYPALKR